MGESREVTRNVRENIKKAIIEDGNKLIEIAHHSQFDVNEIHDFISTDKIIPVQFLVDLSNYFKVSTRYWFQNPKNNLSISVWKMASTIDKLEESAKLRFYQAVIEYDELPPHKRTEKRMEEIFFKWMPKK